MKKYITFFSIISLLAILVIIPVKFSGKKNFEVSCQPNDAECLSEVFLDYSKKNGFKPTLLQLEGYVKLNPSATTSCHSVAHKLGANAWRKYSDISEVYNNGNGVCSFGFLHGAISQAFEELSNESILQNANSFCKSLKNDNFAASDECDHGLGHASILKFKNFKDGIYFCTLLVPERSAHSCIQGSIMEYSSNFPIDQLTASRLASELYRDCIALEDVSFIKACIFSSGTTSIRSDGQNGDGSKAWGRCLEIANLYLDDCSDGIGVGAPAITNWSFDKTKSICSALPLQYQIRCLQSAVKIFGTVFLDFQKSESFCSILSKETIEFCRAELPKLKITIEDYRKARA